MVIDSLQTVAGILVMLAIGYFLGVKNIISQGTKTDMNKLLVRVFIPCAVLSGFQNSVDISMMAEMGVLAIANAVAIIASVIFAFIVAIVFRVKKKNRGVFISIACFPNAAFIGIPVVTSLFGNEGLPYAIIMIVVGYIVINPLCYHYAKVDAARHSGQDVKFSLKAFSKNMLDPLIAIAAIAIILLLLNIQLPKFIMLPINLFSDLTSPLSLLIAGYVIAKCDKSKLKPDKDTLVATFLRLFVSCAIIYGSMYLFGIGGFIADVTLIQFTLPCMVLVIIVAEQFGADGTFAAKGFVYTVLGSVITMPIYSMIFAS